TYQKLPWVLPGAPIAGRRVRCRPVQYRGRVGRASELVSLDLRWVSVTSASPARDGLAGADLVALVIEQRARTGARASAQPVCRVYGAARVQSALPDKTWCRQQAATIARSALGRGPQSITPSNHLIVEER